nr:hypothetical protein [uncultured Rhodoferax sp.]
MTTEHVKKQNRKQTYLTIFLIFLSAGCVAALFNAASVSNKLFALIGLFVFAQTIYRTYKIRKEGEKSYPTLELDEKAGTIAVAHKDVVVTVDIKQIKNLRLQHKSTALESVIVTTCAGEVMRFEGYENLELLAESLKRLTPADRVSNAKFYHR